MEKYTYQHSEKDKLNESKDNIERDGLSDDKNKFNLEGYGEFVLSL